VAQADAGADSSGELFVNGSRIRQSNRNARPAPLEAQRSAKARPESRDYQAFLSNLQRAVRADDRSAIVGLISYPLRVNYRSGARSYRDGRSVERDFDRIFTSQVRRAVLAQAQDQLFTRDIGAMVGDGELWFDRTSPGVVKIIAVNP
jgi:hypothetical protein